MTDTLYDYDPEIKVESHVHEEDGKLTVAEFQDAEDIVEQNKFLYAGVDERARFGNEMFTRAAQIPLSVYLELYRTGVAQDEAAFKRWLNDRDNLLFRTRPGRI